MYNMNSNMLSDFVTVHTPINDMIMLYYHETPAYPFGPCDV